MRGVHGNLWLNPKSIPNNMAMHSYYTHSYYIEHIALCINGRKVLIIQKKYLHREYVIVDAALDYGPSIILDTFLRKYYFFTLPYT